MPDAGNTHNKPTAEFEAAKAAVTARLSKLGISSRALITEELATYSKHRFAAGWRFPVQFSDDLHCVDLLLPAGFPWQAPRVALVDKSHFLKWPHVEQDGILCLTPDTLEIDPGDPAGSVACVLDDACELIGKLITGVLNKDFQDEFLSYWDHAANSFKPSFISLLQVGPPSREVRVWRSKKFYVLAEVGDEIEKWLTNWFGEEKHGYRQEAAAFLWLDAPPIPDDYPQTGHNLRQLAASAGTEATALLTKLTRTCPDELVAALCFSTANGPVVVGVIAPAPTALRDGARAPANGFRKYENMPDLYKFFRYLGDTKLVRQSVERADSNWIHGRGQDSRTAQLKEKRVAVVGCGSVGATVATTLAQAGVGNLVLIDFDILKWCNIGRHSLGAGCVDQPKSEALAEKLRSDFPHLTVTYYENNVDTVIRQHADALADCHLVVSATGAWAADSRLDAWQKAVRWRVPIIYGWLEAHACAGHAVLIQDTHGSLQTGFDRTGLPHFRVTTWPIDTTLRHEPACGATFQPYGPVELAFVNGLIADLALDLLLNQVAGNVHRVWVCPRKRLIESNGAWSESWKANKDFRKDGGFILEQPWPATFPAGVESLQVA